MQNKIHRVLSLLLVVIMVLSMIPAALAAETSASAVYAAENTTTGAQYADVNEAIAAAQAGQIVKVLADAENVAYGNAGVILDLNGCNMTNVTVAEGVTLTAIDSATDDYEGAYGSLTTEGEVAATVKTTDPKSYVAICDNGSYSFHRYYASIAAISLQPSKVSLGYRAEFRGDEAVKNAVVSYGYELWANDNAHKTYARTDKLEKSSLTLRLSNILREDNDALNAVGSTATIGGNAFISLDLGNEQVTLYGTQQETTLRQVVEAVNATASQYGEAQLASVREMITTYSAWMMGWATENIFGSGEGTEGDGLKVEIVVDVNAENNILSQDATMSYGDITATVPQGAVLENGVKQLVLTITEKAKSDSDVTEGEGETLIPLDVHISGISADNTAPIVICLGDILPKGLNIGNYDLFHVENGKTVSMTRVYTVAELDAHNEFYYDPATGSVTVAMASFSEIALRTIDENQWNGSEDTSWYDESESEYEICNADQLAGLGALVDGGNTFEGKAITMIADIDLLGYEGEEQLMFNPIGYGYSFSEGQVFKGIFDGNGNTIYNLYQNGWDLEAKNDGEDYTYSTAGGGLFASIEDATIKNLTMDGANIVMECVDMGTVVGYANGNCTFQNIIVKNSTVQNYNRYTGGVIGEVGGGGVYTINNVDVEKTTTLSALWGTFDPSVGGIIGGVWHEAGSRYGKGNDLTVTMTNCDVACKLDVYNDVTSAYQWYSYRRCGMLIGYTEENKTVNGRTEATASFLTTENCTVTYGKWANYHYCEFNETTSMGARYPWVRVEAGLSNGAYSNARYGVPTFDGATLDVTNHTEEDGCHGDNDQHNILVAFHQLYGGGQGCYGGNTHVEEDLGVTEQSAPDAAYKFKAKVESGSFIQTGTSVKLGDLFEATGNGEEIQNLDVYAFVSPVDTNDSVRATMNYNSNNWEERTLSFTGTGLAKITISDYYYCKARTLIVNVGAGVVRFWDYNSVSSDDCGDNGVILPTADAEEGKTFIGWSEEKVAKGTVVPEVITAGTTYYPQKDVVDLYAVYSYTGSSNTTYTLVTDASTLAVDDIVVIANSGVTHALGTTQNSNNRAGVVITNNGDGTITINESAVQLLTLTAGETDGTFGLYTGSGYLYAAASGSNHLKTQTTNNVNGYWTITVTNDVASIVASGSSNRNVMQYNPNNNSPIFACYSSASQTALKLYKQTVSTGSDGTYYESLVIEECNHTNTTETRVEPTCQTEGSVTVICNDCREITVETLPVGSHNYVDGVCGTCGEEQPKNALVTDMSVITAGGTFAIVAEYNGKYYALGPAVDNGKIAAQEVTIVNDVITSDVAVWTLEAVDGGVAIVYGEKYLSYSSGTDFSQNTSPYTWTVAENNGTFKFTASKVTTRQIMLSESTLKFGAYSTSNNTGYISNLYVYVVNPCEHTNTTTTTVDATCTEDGSTSVTCDDCGQTISTTNVAALGHTTENGTCERCGEVIGSTIEPTYGWVKVTDASTLKAGDEIILYSSNSKGNFVAGNIFSSVMDSIQITGTPSDLDKSANGATILTLGSTSGKWTLANTAGKLLGATAAKKLAWGSGTTTWSISIANGVATIQNGTSSYGRILYNTGSPRFTTYTSNTSTSMLLPEIYRWEPISE